jgi:hypothetical protein
MCALACGLDATRIAVDVDGVGNERRVRTLRSYATAYDAASGTITVG